MPSAAIQAPAPVERRSSLRLPGGVFAGTTLFVAIGALNSQNNLLFWVFGLAVGAVVMSGLVSGAGMMGVRARRSPLETARAGEPWTVRYRVENAARLTPAVALHVEERSTRGGVSIWGFGVGVAPGARATINVTTVPERRGRVELDGPRVWSTFPFGLTRKQIRFAQPGAAIILPTRLPLRTGMLGDLLARAAVGQQSARPSNTGDELFAVREYSPGDSPRRVAWRASARHGELRVRQFSEQVARSVWLELLVEDAEPHEVERTIALAASLAEEALAQRVSVGVSIPAWGFRAPPSAGAARSCELLDALAVAGPSDEASTHARIGHTPSRDVVQVGVHVGPGGLDVRRPEDWLAVGASMPATLEVPSTAERERMTLRRRLSRVIDRLVGGGDDSASGGAA
ncbi:MAG: DUF58 domain-containing protein [Planctomycetota bacterium]